MRLFFIFILLSNILYSQENFRCSNLSMKDGLSSNYVECVLTDKRGFTWIGTWNGVCRYDGHGIKKYMPTLPPPTSLNGNWIFTIREDKYKQLWLGTNMGLFLYIAERDSFILKASPQVSVNAITPDNTGVLWLGTRDGIVLFDPVSQTIKTSETESLRQSELLRNTIRDIVADSKNNVWLATERNGLVKINLKNKRQTIYSANTQKNSIASNKLNTITFDKHSRLWIGTQDRGLCVLDTIHNTFSSYEHSPQDKTSIGSNNVFNISCDSQGTMWVSCSNGYLNKYIEASNNFYRFEYNKAVPDNISPRSVKGLYTQSNGNRWISTHGEGVYLYNKEKNKIRSISLLSETSRTNFIMVSSFAQLNNNRFLVGSDGEGLWDYDSHKGLVRQLNVTNGLSSNAIHTVIYEKQKKSIWLSSWGGGITEIDENLNTKHIYKNHGLKGDVVSDNSKGLFFDDSVLWVSTHGEGLCYFDLQKKQFVQTPRMKVPSWGNSVFRDSKHRLWVACLDGLYLYDNDTIKKFKNTDQGSHISSNMMLQVFEDSKQRLWAVSNKGIDRYDESSGQFCPKIRYSQLNTDFKSLVEDNRGLFWIGSDNGVFCIDIERAVVLKHLSQTNGLLHNNCFQNAAFKSSDGTLFFGLQGGFSAFHPDSLICTQEKPELVITDLYINNILQRIDKQSFYPQQIQTADSLVLRYSKNIISLQFTGLAVSNPQAMQYWYKLEGFSDNWISLGTTRNIVLANIAPGTYRLIIKGVTNNGSVGYNGNGLSLIITPCWWQTLWFRIAISFIIISIIILFIRFRIYRIRQENLRLETTVSQRTAELSEANIQLFEQAEKLRANNDVLFNNQILIQEKNKELNDTIHTKDRIISIVAHDLKNPMGALHGIAQLLHKYVETGYPEKLQKMSLSILNSSEIIMNQMVSLLDWAHSQMHTIKYRAEEISVDTLITDSISLLEESVKKKEIAIHIKILVTHTALIDSRMIATVIRNLVSNSIKFTPRGGEITIFATEQTDEICIEISDTGIGIPPEKLETLFDETVVTTSYGTENEKGTGLGLKICKEFVLQNKGTLQVESVLGKRTSFRITLPVGSEIAREQNDSVQFQIDPKTEKLVIARTKSDELILVIEDNKEMLQLIVDSLTPSFTIETANNGIEGLDKARNLLPDLILSDVKMPGYSGTELCEMTKSDPLTSHIPFLMLTSEDTVENQITGFRTGADDYIIKPFNAEVLLSKLETIFKNKEIVRQHLKKQLLSQPSFPEMISKDDVLLDKLTRMIEQQLGNPELSVEDLAKHLGMSRVQLFRKCKSILGQSPTDFLRLTRLKAAAELLRTGKHRVSEVAYEVGFNDANHFSACFLKQYGLTPSQFMKEGD